MASLPTTFDHIIVKYAGIVPVNYIRTLIKTESGFNPNSFNGVARGLLQVTGVVIDGFNQRYGTSFSRDDTFNPDVNIRMGADLINRIAKAYDKHPSSNMKINWSNPEFVKLVTAGFNSGFSESGGTGKVASFLEARGMPVTHDNVFANAAAAGATVQLQRPEKKAYQQKVAKLYFDTGGPGGMSLVTFVVLCGGGYLLWRHYQNKGGSNV